jgi:ribonuclease P protein component
MSPLGRDAPLPPPRGGEGESRPPSGARPPSRPAAPASESLPSVRGLGFPKALRVVLRADFDAVRTGGRTVRDGVLRVRYLARPGQPTRLGLAVSRRAGNAVRRNRIKRIVREAFRHAWDALPPGLDLVVSPADPRRASRLEEVRRSLASLAAQAASGRRAPPRRRRRKKSP